MEHIKKIRWFSLSKTDHIAAFYVHMIKYIFEALSYFLVTMSIKFQTDIMKAFIEIREKK